MLPHHCQTSFPPRLRRSSRCGLSDSKWTSRQRIHQRHSRVAKELTCWTWNFVRNNFRAQTILFSYVFVGVPKVSFILWVGLDVLFLGWKLWLLLLLLLWGLFIYLFSRPKKERRWKMDGNVLLWFVDVVLVVVGVYMCMRQNLLVANRIPTYFIEKCLINNVDIWKHLLNWDKEGWKSVY